MAIIDINKLVKIYDGNSLEVRALNEVDLRVEKGEFTAIAGPSGSGKTTLLNLIGGLDQPTHGSLTVAGKDLRNMSVRELSDMRLNNIGFIFQAYNLIPVLTALENVEYILLLQGVAKEERRERSTRILEEVGLGKEINRRPKELSGGQQQRVAVARAIVSEPELVLADEPTANLDQKTGAGLLDLMHDLNHRKNITFIFSTHDSMVMDYAERLIHLSDGRIVSDEKKKSSRESRERKTPGKKKK
ncbi:MAG TPA: ABC transporter ATP-binding protein [Spirochaetota bacterium]|nr:ABC transporter ATP-binding protein [Spirochaetota bacterium]HOD15576.1 ABC transporter ATP-binding protein [Spirochaetota bacterium]HPG49131.1 ABC transporter ATP-binding protein [Spirochaetota bacterium]HPN13479.1 ABC transporter ATP-binding protein [Spirochaetota bacterium]HQL81887.1 ABC transporter ATP-binding protein [Spirochaetota bacterium]